MRPRSRWLAPSLFAASLLAVGCGGTGNDVAPDAAQGQAGDPPAGQKTRSGVSELTTPSERVDPKAVVDVVKEEIKGGEATAPKPTPLVLLYAEGDPKLVKDEPLVVPVPAGFPPLLPPASNPMTVAKVELGKQLYFDPRVSKDGTVSCATCHNPEKAWTDNLPASIGIDGQIGSRNSPTVLNTAYGKTMFWDGRAPSLEGQAQGPIQNKIEMGDQSYGEIVERLRGIPGYKDQFAKVFGAEVTLDGMAKAIAAFERTALSGNSAYDKYTSGEQPKALTDSQKRGMILFGLRLDQDDDFQTDVVLKKANCTSCHAGFNFTDEEFHNLGVGYDEKASQFADVGRFAISPIGAKDPSESGAFKTPTVRDAARTFPYMHDGSQKTLEEVIEHYDKGGNANPYLDPDMKKLNLTPTEKADLVEFMKALNGEEIKVALPTLPPGPDGKAPDAAAALTPPGPKAAMHFTQPAAIR